MLDHRLHVFRPDLAEQRLEGQVAAERFVTGHRRVVVASATPLKEAPGADAPLGSELIRGETVEVFEESPEGWSWVRNEADGYVGYAATDALGEPGRDPTHHVATLRTFVYPGPDMKLPAIGWLSLGSRLAFDGEAETRGTRFLLLANGEGAVVASHVLPLDAEPEPDFVAVAGRFLETPYLWGGRTSLGLDCSALVQVSLTAAGKACPRDTDMQEKMLGHLVEGGAEAGLARGDLVFWTGHVGIMQDAVRMVHASGHHMRVVSEPLAGAVDRIARSGGWPTGVRRL